MKTIRKDLFTKPQKPIRPKNIFEREAFKQSVQTVSGNGSLKYKTTGNIFVDDFAKLGNYLTPRDINEVYADMEKLWATDALTTLKEEGYVRGITRQPVFNGKKLDTLRAQGLKSEAKFRLAWIAENHPSTYKKNLAIFVAEGSWKDLFDVLEILLSYNGVEVATKLPAWNYTINFIIEGLADKEQNNLIKKYLPTIRATKNLSLHRQCSTFIGRAIAQKLFPNINKASAYKKYRLLKASGTAHEWEQVISRQQFDKLPSMFDKIAGRALSALTKNRIKTWDGKRADGTSWLSRHNLEQAYTQWLSKQPVAKFTGFAFELFKPLCGEGSYDAYKNYNKLAAYQLNTINKQFAELLKKGKTTNNKSNFIVALDSSGSMTSKAKGIGMSAWHVGLSMGLYFSELLTGKFAHTILEFDDTCEVRTFKGKTYTDKFTSFTPGDWGSTNFLSVAKLFAQLKQKGYPESEFPTGVLAISDGEFNRTTSNTTNFDTLLSILSRAGFSEEFVRNFTIVLWDIPNSYYSRDVRPKFESLADEGNFFYMSGFDGAAITFLTTGDKKMKSIPKTPEELFNAAMNQELLNKLKVQNVYSK